MSTFAWKVALALAVVLPLTVRGVPVGFQTEDGTITPDGYVIRHSGAVPTVDGASSAGRKDLSSGWWTMFTREDGTGFDAESFIGGSLWDKIPQGVTPAILVQGQTLDGAEYSQVVHLTLTGSGENALFTFELDDSFENLAWIRFSSLDLNPGFTLQSVDLNPAKSVPESGPGVLLMTAVFAALGWAGFQAARTRQQLPARVSILRRRSR